MNLTVTQFMYKNSINVCLIDKDEEKPIVTIKLDRFSNIKEIKIEEDYRNYTMFRYCLLKPNDLEDEYFVDLEHAYDRGIIRRTGDCYTIDFDKCIVKINVKLKLSLLISAETKILVRGVAGSPIENAQQAANIVVETLDRSEKFVKLSRFPKGDVDECEKDS